MFIFVHIFYVFNFSFICSFSFLFPMILTFRSFVHFRSYFRCFWLFVQLFNEVTLIHLFMIYCNLQHFFTLMIPTTPQKTASWPLASLFCSATLAAKRKFLLKHELRRSRRSSSLFLTYASVCLYHRIAGSQGQIRISPAPLSSWEMGANFTAKLSLPKVAGFLSPCPCLPN